ncbi:MAG: hypothetical protein KGJ35_00350 [Patescibacteria group bacterium]|nr:hypothetical protein [Patescibacteria group bacterium]
MKQKIYTIVSSGIVALALTLAAGASAQTTYSTATMPVFYNQYGAQVNAGTAALPAGTYYLAPNGTEMISYYGNGVYYEPGTGTYGGSSVNDPNGTAGVSLGYSSSVGGTPGVPNTGLGGFATRNWLYLLFSGFAVLIGATYVFKQTRFGLSD